MVSWRDEREPWQIVNIRRRFLSHETRRCGFACPLSLSPFESQQAGQDQTVQFWYNLTWQLHPPLMMSNFLLSRPSRFVQEIQRVNTIRLQCCQFVIDEYIPLPSSRCNMGILWTHLSIDHKRRTGVYQPPHAFSHLACIPGGDQTWKALQSQLGAAQTLSSRVQEEGLRAQCVSYAWNQRVVCGGRWN